MYKINWIGSWSFLHCQSGQWTKLSIHYTGRHISISIGSFNMGSRGIPIYMLVLVKPPNHCLFVLVCLPPICPSHFGQLGLGLSFDSVTLCLLNQDCISFIIQASTGAFLGKWVHGVFGLHLANKSIACIPLCKCRPL